MVKPQQMLSDLVVEHTSFLQAHAAAGDTFEGRFANGIRFHPSVSSRAGGCRCSPTMA